MKKSESKEQDDRTLLFEVQYRESKGNGIIGGFRKMYIAGKNIPEAMLSFESHTKKRCPFLGISIIARTDGYTIHGVAPFIIK